MMAMDTCEYCDDDLAVPASPTLDPGTDEVRLACARCGHVVSLERAGRDRFPIAA